MLPMKDKRDLGMLLFLISYSHSYACNPDLFTIHGSKNVEAKIISLDYTTTSTRFTATAATHDFRRILRNHGNIVIHVPKEGQSYIF